MIPSNGIAKWIKLTGRRDGEGAGTRGSFLLGTRDFPGEFRRDQIDQRAMARGRDHLEAGEGALFDFHAAAGDPDHSMRFEKSGSWPTMATRLNSWNTASSCSARSGFMPQASHPWMTAPGMPAVSQNSSAVWRARTSGLVSTMSGSHFARFNNLAARRACWRPFSTRARALSPSGLIFGLAVTEENEVHGRINAEMWKTEMRKSEIWNLMLGRFQSHMVMPPSTAMTWPVM